MRVPIDIPLVVWIRQLYKLNKIYLFYKTADWIELKNEVLEDYHNECQMCIKKGKVTRADCVHHINHVRNRPDMALTRYYEENGEQKENLIPLCDACHNKEHPEKFGSGKSKDKFVNEERW